MVNNNWYVITGGPSTGKTTLLAELEKLGHKTIPEAARMLIDDAIAKCITVEQLRADEKHFQEEVARLKEKIEAAHDSQLLTFFDRGMQDTAAYMRQYGFAIEQWAKELMHKARYRQVFLLEPLPTYERDYARTESHDFTKHLHRLLHEAYAEFGMEPVHVPALDPKARAKFVLDHIKMEQKV